MMPMVQLMVPVPGTVPYGSLKKSSRGHNFVGAFSPAIKAAHVVEKFARNIEMYSSQVRKFKRDLNSIFLCDTNKIKTKFADSHQYERCKM